MIHFSPPKFENVPIEKSYSPLKGVIPFPMSLNESRDACPRLVYTQDNMLSFFS